MYLVPFDRFQMAVARVPSDDKAICEALASWPIAERSVAALHVAVPALIVADAD